MTTIKLWFNTLRYLRCIQVYYRVFYFIRNKLGLTRVFKIKNSDFSLNDYGLKYRINKTTSSYRDGFFCLLNKNVHVDTNTWKVNESDLWEYNLHYFDYIHDLPQDTAQMLVESWVSSYTSKSKTVASSPYPTSLRLVNWFKLHQNGFLFSRKARESIFEQAFSLYHHIEYHLLGNHLFSNSKALIFSGVYLKCQMSELFLNAGVRILKKEIKEQFLLDGAHFELSPMYNNIMLNDVIEIYYLLSNFDDYKYKEILTELKSVIEKSFQWSTYMSHPDGDVSFFNDSTLGVAPNLYDLEQSISFYGLDFVSLKEKTVASYLAPCSKYFVYSSSKYKLISDYAQIGPSYLPGHAHADNLSFELSVGKQRFVVNSGISEYGTGPLRKKQRNTSSHNTVELYNASSSEMWCGFRVGRRAKTTIEEYVPGDKAFIVGHHNGYTIYGKDSYHTRSFECTETSVTIIDRILPDLEGKSYLHLHPDVSVRLASECEMVLNYQQQILHITFAGLSSVELHDSSYYPGFGLEKKNKTIVVSFSHKLITKLETINA